jgi:hypothetical protein
MASPRQARPGGGTQDTRIGLSSEHAVARENRNHCDCRNRGGGPGARPDAARTAGGHRRGEARTASGDGGGRRQDPRHGALSGVGAGERLRPPQRVEGRRCGQGRTGDRSDRTCARGGARSANPRTGTGTGERCTGGPGGGRAKCPRRPRRCRTGAAGTHPRRVVAAIQFHFRTGTRQRPQRRDPRTRCRTGRLAQRQGGTLRTGNGTCRRRQCDPPSGWRQPGGDCRCGHRSRHRF